MWNFDSRNGGVATPRTESEAAHERKLYGWAYTAVRSQGLTSNRVYDERFLRPAIVGS